MARAIVTARLGLTNDVASQAVLANLVDEAVTDPDTARNVVCALSALAGINMARWLVMVGLEAEPSVEITQTFWQTCAQWAARSELTIWMAYMHDDDKPVRRWPNRR